MIPAYRQRVSREQSDLRSALSAPLQLFAWALCLSLLSFACEETEGGSGVAPSSPEQGGLDRAPIPADRTLAPPQDHSSAPSDARGAIDGAVSIDQQPDHQLADALIDWGREVDGTIQAHDGAALYDRFCAFCHGVETLLWQ